MLLGEENQRDTLYRVNDNYGAELETIAVKLSRKFVYEEELRKEKAEKGAPQAVAVSTSEII